MTDCLTPKDPNDINIVGYIINTANTPTLSGPNHLATIDEVQIPKIITAPFAKPTENISLINEFNAIYIL